MSGCASEGCALDSRGCVGLDKILQSFGAPISEEQAWALCYGFCECYSALASERRRSKFYLATSLKHVILTKDGFVHEETFLPLRENCKNRTRASNEGKLVSDLGVVLYRALDYSLGSDEERDLSPTLDRLIDLMTSAEPERGETDDEGIERDSGDSEEEHQCDTLFTVREATKICEDRLVSEGVNKGVDEHYKAVIRALIAEAVDLTTFLKTVAQSTKFATRQADLLSSEKDLHELQCEDWARLWKQVMKQLREGVKLKKVDYTMTPLEYALTPYEMLMEDIRSRRYTLNKVTVNGDIEPKVKKDAHTIILDFIRSRPPLRKASDRKLAPLRKISSPMELLMDSIKASDNIKLKHVPSPIGSRPLFLSGEGSHSLGHSPQPKRKLIEAPRFNLSTEDEDDDDLEDVPPSSPRLPGSPLLGETLSGVIHTYASLNTTPASPRSLASASPDKQNCSSHLSRVAYDLANYGKSSAPGRRHSISICETPMAGPNSRCNTPTNSSGPPSRSSPPGSPSHKVFASTSQTQRDFLSSAHFSSRLDCLSLTLEEVVHIRNVLTKADLESLPLDLSIKEDVGRGKICFLCMKTRFGFFGPKGLDCRLCRRTVCKKCVTRMRIPTEHFSNIPVIMLTPQALSPKEEDEQSTMSLPRSFLNMLQFKRWPTVFTRQKSIAFQYMESTTKSSRTHDDLTADKLSSFYSTLSLCGSLMDIPRGPNSGVSERRGSISGSVGSAPTSPASLRSSLGGGPSSLYSSSPAPCVNYDIRKAPALRRAMTLCHVATRKKRICGKGDQTQAYKLKKKVSFDFNVTNNNIANVPNRNEPSYKWERVSNKRITSPKAVFHESTDLCSPENDLDRSGQQTLNSPCIFFRADFIKPRRLSTNSKLTRPLSSSLLSPEGVCSLMAGMRRSLRSYPNSIKQTKRLEFTSTVNKISSPLKLSPRRKQELRLRNQEMEDRLRGELMAVCLDCKAMVLHVLMSIKLRRDKNEEASPLSSDPARNHLHLNLTPVY